jgi:hypothetical protein
MAEDGENRAALGFSSGQGCVGWRKQRAGQRQAGGQGGGGADGREGDTFFRRKTNSSQ